VSTSPLLEFGADQFGTIVHTQPSGFAADLDEFVECSHDAPCRQTRIDLDAQGFAVVIVNDVERTEASTRPQCVRLVWMLTVPVEMSAESEAHSGASRKSGGHATDS
jgi:hypothetical protein